MAIYTDPRTGQQRRTDDLGRTSYSSSWGSFWSLFSRLRWRGLSTVARA